MSEITAAPKLSTPFKERLIQFARKNMGLISVLISLLAILFALLIGAILMALADINPWEAYSYLVKGSFRNRYGFGETLTRFVPAK